MARRSGPVIDDEEKISVIWEDLMSHKAVEKIGVT